MRSGAAAAVLPLMALAVVAPSGLVLAPNTLMYEPIAHFARVLPVVGAVLHERRVALIDAAAGAEVAGLLAACGVLRWSLSPTPPVAAADPLARCFGVGYIGQAAHLALPAALAAQHGSAPPWEWELLPSTGQLADLASLDLVLVAGSEANLAHGQHLAAAHACPLIWLCPPATITVSTWATGYPLSRLATGNAYATPDPFAAAALAKALLLCGTAYARPDIEQLLTENVLPPTPESAVPFALATSTFQTPLDAPVLRERSALVIGCGSLGSLIAYDLARVVRRLVLVDGGMVSLYNPVRQLYTVQRVGQPKAVALCAELHERLGVAAPELLAHSTDIDDETQIAELVAQYQPTLAVVSTGTYADFALARGLRAAGVAHLVGRCYPRARYWEAILVPDAAAPCLGCLRGQLYTGPPPAPTPEEAARYTSAGDLQSEPATLVESGWAAACMARLALQLLAPPGLREHWCSTLIARQQTCLIGGAYAPPPTERATPSADPLRLPYGIARPGQVRAYGLAEVLGSAATRICADCGRQWPVYYRVADEA